MPENGFSDNQFSIRILPCTRSYLDQNKKVVLTGYWEASARCTLLESMFNIYTFGKPISNVIVVVVVFTLKAVPVSTQYFLTSVLVQLTRTPSVVTG